MKIIKEIRRINPRTNNEEIMSVVKSIVYPINSVYEQYPHEDDDETYVGFRNEDEPATLFGGTWVLQYNDKGVFFRTDDHGAVDSNAYNPTRLPGSTGTMNNRTNGVQTDAIRNITGTWTAYELSGYHDQQVYSSGAFYHHAGYIYKGSKRKDRHSAIIGLNANKQIATSSENRPINMLIKIWRRVG